MKVLLFLLIASFVPGNLFTKYKPLVLEWDGKDLEFPPVYFGDLLYNQLYYCPAETNIQEQFLVPVEDKKSNCEKPITPLLKKSEELTIGCGGDGKSMYYDFLYRAKKPLVENSENKKKSEYQNLVVYRICFNEERKETIFSYYLMISPSLLKNENLQKERKEVQEIDTYGYQLLDINFTESLRKAYNKISLGNKLKPLMLISPFDIAFSVLKKPTYNYFNVVPAWKKVMEMWNIINDYLRDIAIEVSKDIRDDHFYRKPLYYKELNMIQISGWKDQLVLGNEKQYLDKTVAVPKYIWKLVYIRREKLIVAIILLNIPDESHYKESDRFCENDERFQKKIDILKNINKSYPWYKLVQFCDHKVITDLYHLPENLEFLTSQEFLLPLVMTYYEGKYQLPETYHGLSKLVDNQHQKQILFCPVDTESNETLGRCLVPNKFYIPYCRKSVEVFYVESKLTDIKCDYTIQDMVYQICAKDNDNTNQIRNRGEPLPTEPYNQVVYSFCIHPTEFRSRFTYHRIISLNLFGNEILKKEGQIGYQSYDPYEVKERHFFDYFNNPYATGSFEKETLFKKNYLLPIPLVPHDDMVFSLFRKATYHIHNMTIAWNNIEILNKVIHQRLRYEALLKNQELIQINGVMDDLIINDSFSLYHGTEKTPKYLWTVVYNPEMTHSIAIVIYNRPEKDYPIETERLCETSICDIQKWDLNMMSNSHSASYCCNANVITEKYGFPETPNVMEIEDLFLPLVLTFYQEKYQFPESFIGLEEHFDNQNRKQTLFCPAETNDSTNIDEYCLVPNEHIVPHCKKPIKYLWVKNKISEIGCTGEDYIDFSVVYRICIQHKSDVDLTVNDREVFRVCYDQKNNRTLYTFDQIKSPALLGQNNLEKQQQMDYPLDTNNYLSPEENFTKLKLAFEKHKFFNVEIAFDETLSVTMLMLTSATHMAFPSLIEPTYHFVNVQPTWKEVQYIWACVNEKLRNIAHKENLKLIQINGLSEEFLELDSNKMYLDFDGRFGFSKYFWKVVYNESMTESVAIVFHNYPRTYISPSNTLCKPRTDLCHIKGVNLIFPDKVPIAYCCESKVITEKFNLPEANSPFKIKDIKC